ncbi:MAG: DEAD/DEAH box helicase [Clostridia bacterium]|nr:DEAD/DEAH box helicase [Clostridia bacterium]
MGLGKTLQMIALFKADKEAAQQSGKRGRKTEPEPTKPSLVICPASLIYNWQEEIEKFAPDLKVTVLSGTQGVRKKALADADGVDVYVTSYDLLKRDIALYEGVSFDNCVLDEAQYIKNAKAAVSKSVKLIQSDHRFALTGTPIENRLSELWSIFDFLMPGFLYSQLKFEKDFEIPIAKYKDEDMTEKLKNMTSPFILRRKKMDVLKDLPAKLEEVRYARLEGEQQTIYDAQVVRMKEMLAGGELAGEEKIKIFAELMRIRQICCDPSLLFENYKGESAKREACLELVKSAIEGGHRMLIFSQFVSMLNLLEEDFAREGIETYKIIGSTPKEKRISMVRQFNDNDVPVFLISLKAGGTGLNLTGADVVIHYDPWWNLAAQNQATDRAHRIGQTRQVTVFKLILKGTIEERIMALQDAKKDLAEAILEGSNESIMSLSAEELMSLLG